MPRKGKGQQAIAEFPSPGYGQGEELAQMQRDLPLPESRSTPELPTAAPPMQDPVALAQQFVNPTGLPPNAPTQRPAVPITNGLPNGPGAGPEVLRGPRRRNPSADTLELLAQISGDSQLAARAARLRQRAF